MDLPRSYWRTAVALFVVVCSELALAQAGAPPAATTAATTRTSGTSPAH